MSTPSVVESGRVIETFEECCKRVSIVAYPRGPNTVFVLFIPVLYTGGLPSCHVTSAVFGDPAPSALHQLPSMLERGLGGTRFLVLSA